jgi:hypothetical protein
MKFGHIQSPYLELLDMFMVLQCGVSQYPNLTNMLHLSGSQYSCAPPTAAGCRMCKMALINIVAMNVNLINQLAARREV